MNRPDIDLIEKLHQAGRQLAVLKRIYQSYALIITRILDKQRQSVQYRSLATASSSNAGLQAISSASAQNISNAGAQSANNPNARDTSNFVHTAEETYGVPFSQAVVVRFERLLDRINLYALTEIQECLDEKDALVFLVSHFNIPQAMHS